MYRLLVEEKGSVLIIVTICMVVLLGFTAWALDGGYLYSRDVEMQNITDAVALASANTVAKTNGGENVKKNKAFQTAKVYAAENGLNVGTSSGYTAQIVHKSGETGTMEVGFPDGISKVKVDIQLNGNLHFAKILGGDVIPISTSATVFIGQAERQTGGLIPVGIVDNGDPGLADDYQTGVQYSLTFGPSGGTAGNYGWLNFDSVSDFSDILEYGFTGTVEVGDTVTTKTGVSTGLAAQAIDDRLSRCSGIVDYSEEGIKTHLESEPDCPRLVYTPIVDSLGDSGTSDIKVLGFAAFFIEEYLHDGNTITLVGRFIGVVSSENVTIGSSGTVHAIRLVE